MKRLKILLLLFALTLSISTFCQTYSTLTSDSIIKDFIKNTIGFKELDYKVFSWDSCDMFQNFNNCILNSFIMKENDSIITKALISEFQNQFIAIRNVTPQFFSFLKNQANKKKFSFVSIPLISSDGNTAVIKYGSWCGNECGCGGIKVYKKIKGKWKLVDYRCTWMS